MSGSYCNDLRGGPLLGKVIILGLNLCSLNLIRIVDEKDTRPGVAPKNCLKSQPASPTPLYEAIIIERLLAKSSALSLALSSQSSEKLEENPCERRGVLADNRSAMRALKSSEGEVNHVQFPFAFIDSK